MLQEFYSVATTKLACPQNDAMAFVQYLSQSFAVCQLSVKTILSAIALGIKNQISFWDSLIVSAALETQCDILYSEDLHDSQVFKNCKIANPFL